MSDLPRGWAESTLGALCEPPKYGWTTSAQKDGSGGLKFLRTTDISRGKLDWTSVPGCADEPSNPEQFRLVRGDIVISRAGSVGLSYRLTNVVPAVFASYLIRFRPSPRIDGRYLAYFLQTRDYWRQIASATSGITLANVNAKKLSAIRLPLAPGAEQRRIVAAIEEQLPRLDAGVSALKRVLSRVEQMTKAVIVAAIPKDIPSNWSLTTVGEAGHVQLGRQRSPRFHSGPNMQPYLRVANVFEDRIDTSDVMAMHFSEPEFRQYELKPGDILLNEGQSPHLLGRPAMYRGDPPCVAFTNSLLRFQARNDILPEWALLVFRRHLHARRFMAESQITTNIAHLSAGRFKMVEFPVPPMEEQRQIVASVDERLSTVALERLSAERSVVRAGHLRSSILSAAFAGKLVPQDPSDEPASILLKRLTAERASSNGHMSSRGHSRE